MSYGMLNDGVTSQGMVHRGYDKYGKRMHMATPKKDMSMKDKKISAGRSAGNGHPVRGDQKRTDVGIK